MFSILPAAQILLWYWFVLGLASIAKAQQAKNESKLKILVMLSPFGFVFRLKKLVVVGIQPKAKFSRIFVKLYQKIT